LQFHLKAHCSNAVDRMAGDERAMMNLPDLLHDIRSCAVCKGSLPLGPRPIVQAGRLARVLVIGQAPGRRAHDSGLPWDDLSGARLRQWMGIDEARLTIPTGSP
jgi:uracil-DNA glycosylase